MENVKLANQVVSHRILNYLHAALQGKFTFLNILSQLNTPLPSANALDDTKQKLQTVIGWLDKLWDGEMLFEEARGEDQGEEADRARSMLQELTGDFTNLTERLQELGEIRELDRFIDHLPFLLACHGRVSYARDNYVRGFLKFGEIFRDRELIQLWERYVPEAEAEIKVTNEYLKIIKDTSAITVPMVEQFTFECRLLSSIFRANVHDIYQLLHTFRGEFTFDKAKFVRPEALLWKKEEIGPIEAGYWRAFNIGVETAVQWKDANVHDPMTAARWLSAGFPVDVAVTWLFSGFPVFDALQWTAGNYTPEQAGIFISKGYPLPTDIPADKAKQILREGMDELAEKREKQLRQQAIQRADSARAAAAPKKKESKPKKAEEKKSED